METGCNAACRESSNSSRQVFGTLMSVFPQHSCKAGASLEDPDCKQQASKRQSADKIVNIVRLRLTCTLAGEHV